MSSKQRCPKCHRKRERDELELRNAKHAEDGEPLEAVPPLSRKTCRRLTEEESADGVACDTRMWRKKSDTASASSGSTAAEAAPVPIWLDCDPGHDDAMAIILAGHSRSLRLLGVSTVVGNQTIDKVTDNALRTLNAAGLGHIGVVKGAHKPLMRDPPLCPEIHGSSGLSPVREQRGADGGSSSVHHTSEEQQPSETFPASDKEPVDAKAPLVIFEAIKRAFQQSGSPIKVIATGSLTNIAVMVLLFPEVTDMAEVVLMGGAMGQGNTGPVMEFNIQTDPEAASIVFNAGWPVTMIPIEVTHTALVTPEVMERIKQRKTPFCDTVCNLLLFFQETYREVFKFTYPPLHDPCAVAFCIAPHTFKVQHMRVDVETKSELSAGQTVCDVWGQSSKPKNVSVAMEMDVAAFWNLMVGAIHHADDVSCMNARGGGGSKNKAVE